ncbi:MAG: M1 family aminopeptidase [Candidatus Sulfotelmatobacter sp.]
MTKVLLKMRGLRVAAAIWLAVCVLPAARAAAENPPEKPAEALYLQLGQVGLDPGRVYQVRGASLDRAAIHITLEDGTISFTQDVMGRITGAFFEGYGEVLLTPPNEVERRSMSLFAGMAILEEHFATAYFRFNDDAANELRPDLRATDNKQEFVEHWGETAKNLASADAMRLLMTFSRMLPVKGDSTSSERADLEPPGNAEDRFLHARLQGTNLGVFDVYFDSGASEQIQAGQAKAAENGDLYYDVWTSFSTSDAGTSKTSGDRTPTPEKERARQGRIEVRRYTITTEVQPPKRIHARARVQSDVKEGGSRTLLFELSRFLQVESVKLDGQPVEFIHNPAVEGTQLSRRGNDLVAVVLPEPTQSGQKIDLEFVYGGEVLAEAGSGLLYVGARGTWYPNRGMAMADFDLEFDYPQGWTLVATGKPTPNSPTEVAAKADGLQRSRWVSERPIPFAGFNLGKYKVATIQAGDVPVETYATTGVERNFPSPRIEVIEPSPSDRMNRRRQLIVPSHPSPAQTEVTVGEAAARAIQYYAARFGPYPYSHLALTQMPGRDSQGWPGLVFLSSYAFLDTEQREQLHFEPYRALLQQSIPAHETAHQWWGDLVTWSSYRDQWFSEGLANYCAMMLLQEKDPAGFRQVMEKYRRDLVAKNKDGMTPTEAGPVTLGVRLLSSRFPEGYEDILYGRGTWLFHMLRTMLKDAAQEGGRKGQSGGSAEEPFVRALRKVRERYEGRSISTGELLDVFAEDIPPSLRYEGKSSLDWFLNGWINGTSLPKLELRGVKFTPKGAGAVVSGTILQKDAPQDLVTSVPVYALVAGKQLVLLGRVFADGEESSFRLSAPAGAHKIVLDANETILTSPK